MQIARCKLEAAPAAVTAGLHQPHRVCYKGVPQQPEITDHSWRTRMQSPRRTLWIPMLLLGISLSVAAIAGVAAEPAGLARAVQPFVDNNTLAGAVMVVANHDRIVALEAVGSADLAAQQPMRAASVVWV